MKRRSLVFCLLLILPLSLIANSELPVKRTFTAEKLNTLPPVIDGVFDDQAWAGGQWTGNFTQQVPKEGEKPSKPSIVKIIYDESNLYVALFLYDNPELISRKFSPRDEFSGDITGIALDSYHNEKTAYEFNLSSAGQKIDIMHTGDGNYDFSWNAVWDGKTAVTDSGWGAEFRIPFSQLRYSNSDEHVFGLHIWRWIDRFKEESQWQLIPVNAPAGVHNFGILDGIQGIRTSRQAELLPYASMKYGHNAQNENPYVSDNSFVPNAGIDAKIGLSSNFTLDATINPDFGQVEADPAVLNLSAYETYFAEKRPFFLEGQEIFDFESEGNQLFYSRRIGAKPAYYPDVNDNEEYAHPELTTILGSAKISGRSANGLSLGILETVTGSEYGKAYSTKLNGSGSDTVNTRKILVEPLTNYFASRIKQELNNGNTIIGGSINSVIRKLENGPVDELNRQAQTAGFDFIQYFQKKNYYLKMNSMFSYLEGSPKAMTKIQESHIHRFQRPDALHIELDTTKTTLTGSSGLLEFARNGGKFRFGTNGSFWSPQLNINDIGFMPETDIIEQQNWVSYNQNQPKKHLRSYSFNLFNRNRWSFGKEHTATNFNLEGFFQLKNLWTLYFNTELVTNYTDTRILRGGQGLYSPGYGGFGVYTETNSSRRAFAEISYSHYLSLLKSLYDNISIGISYNPFDKFRLKANAYYEYKQFAYEFFDADFEDDPENIYLMASMDQKTLGMTFRAEYYIRPELSFQYYGNPLLSIVDYSDISRVDDPSAHAVEKRFYVFSENELSFDENENTYTANENNGKQYSFTNPDVIFGEFRSNFVMRYEYKLGSVFYLVWAHQQGKYDNEHATQMVKVGSDLLKESPNDVVMLKFSYWFNI